ncbi:MAG: GNAT family N-acetyltransferase [Rhodospirillaceae bacterium]|nr:MAG: GNAT family N-acetyltransferase [Rhodospirillaceae bacterium]
MTTIAIRPASAEDSDSVAHVVRESWLASNRDLLPADTVRRLEHSDTMSRFAADQWRNIWVAEVTASHVTEIVGVVGLGANGVIWMLYVLPGYQGCGVGSALYDYAIGTLKSAGQRKAVLEVLAANENAVAFYRSRGWVPEGRRTEHIPGFRFTAVRMGLALA